MWAKSRRQHGRLLCAGGSQLSPASSAQDVRETFCDTSHLELEHVHLKLDEPCMDSMAMLATLGRGGAVMAVVGPSAAASRMREHARPPSGDISVARALGQRC